MGPVTSSHFKVLNQLRSADCEGKGKLRDKETLWEENCETKKESDEENWKQIKQAAERQTDRHVADRQAGSRQTGRQTGWQKDIQTDRQIDIRTERHTVQADRKIGRQTSRQTNKHTDRHACRQTEEPEDRQTNGQADRKTDRQLTDRQLTDRQLTDRQTDRQKEWKKERQPDKQIDWQRQKVFPCRGPWRPSAPCPRRHCCSSEPRARWLKTLLTLNFTFLRRTSVQYMYVHQWYVHVVQYIQQVLAKAVCWGLLIFFNLLTKKIG